MKSAKTGAVLFVLWGLLHIVGGAMILMAVSESPEKGFAMYQQSTGEYTDLAGSILGYLAYGFVWLGVVVAVVGIKHNWHNSQQALMLNTALVGLTEIGLIFFLVLPGFLSWGEAIPGLALFVGAAVFGGIGCQSSHDPN